jgi:hypothetical protein
VVEEEEGLHELYEYLPDDVHVEAFIILRLDVGVEVHAKHLSDDTLHTALLTMWPRN